MKMSGAHSGVRANEYNLTVVRELLLVAFTDSDLRRFCLDDPRFRFVCDHFGEQFSHYKLVDTLIRQCLRVNLLPELLPAIEKENPRQFERFAGRLLGPSEAGTLDALFPGPFQAPPLPAHFVPRLEVSEAVKAALLADSEAPGVLVVSAIQGLGGIGKSALAAALAHDPQVRASFPDGVLWATLGQEPEILSLLAGWLREGLRDHDYQPLRVKDATLHLRTLLQDKACLLVIDDVWNPDEARPFLAGGAQCRALVTTRRVDVADALVAGFFSLDLMTDDQSLALLAARLGRPLAGGERTEALLVARAVGNLPLALELAAARVGRGVTWSELCTALEVEVARLEALESPRDRRGQPRLEAAFRLSLDALRGEDPKAWRAFVWLGVLPEDVTVAAPAAATLWEVTVAEADDLLELLWSDALLLPGVPVSVGGRTWRGYRLHDLLRAMARRLLESAVPCGVGLTLLQVHATLLDRYRTRTRDGLWHTLPDDDYIHDHLTWHMTQAGCEDEIHALLREETPAGRNGWYEVRERLGQTGGYLADVRRAWHLAQSEAVGAIGVGFTCRYALVMASLNSLAGKIPPKLLVALVGEGIWTVDQGLVYGRQVPDLGQRAEVLGQLGPYLPVEWREHVLGEALAAARAIVDERGRVEALALLGRHMPEGQREDVLGEALAAARAIVDERVRMEALALLGRHMPEGQRGKALEEVLAAARSIWNKNALRAALVGSRPHFPAGQMGDVLVAAQAVRHKQGCVWGLAFLESHLPEGQREEALTEALVAVQAIMDEEDRAEALAEMGPYLTAGLLTEALDAARAIRYELARVEALAGLEPHLPEGEREEVLREALAVGRAIWVQGTRARALAELGSHLPDGQRKEVLGEALATAWTIQDKEYQDRALAELALYLPAPLWEEVLGEALTAARAIWDGGARARALAGLVPRLPEGQRAEVLGEALAAVRVVWNNMARAEALARLGPHLPEEMLGEALDAARAIRYEWARVEALAGLGPHLPVDLLRQTLAVVQTIENEWWRAQVMAGMGAYLPGELLGEALAATRAIGDDGARAEALAGLGAYLPEGLLGEALAAARAIGDEGARVEALAGLAMHLPEGQRENVLEEVLTSAQAIWDVERRVRVLTGLETLLPEEQRAELMGELLALARTIGDVEHRVRALTGLGSRLPEDQRTEVLAEALSVVRTITEEHPRADALARLGPHLSVELLEDALAQAWAIYNEEYRAQALTELGRTLAKLPYASLNKLGSETLHKLTARTRLDLLSDLQSLTPVLAALGGESAVVEAFRAIQDVGRWWP